MKNEEKLNEKNTKVFIDALISYYPEDESLEANEVREAAERLKKQISTMRKNTALHPVTASNVSAIKPTISTTAYTVMSLFFDQLYRHQQLSVRESGQQAKQGRKGVDGAHNRSIAAKEATIPPRIVREAAPMGTVEDHCRSI